MKNWQLHSRVPSFLCLISICLSVALILTAFLPSYIRIPPVLLTVLAHGNMAYYLLTHTKLATVLSIATMGCNICTCVYVVQLQCHRWKSTYLDTGQLIEDHNKTHDEQVGISSIESVDISFCWIQCAWST